ncbi:hypothetical protein GJ744_002204 [Endocarpon pusillum]|uniref:Uncharacterized protein n=1 Tax=Endocarpon pusillum TaxID=364733 RepID=A0A8H7AB18_9EURO|nr:hypothetical protein GJ744_002204 [Endocarpon pusillum]
MVELAEKKQTSVASHATLLAAFEKESIVLTTSSDKACVKEGYPSFQNRQRWVQIIGVDSDKSVKFLEDPDSQMLFISSEDETPTTIKVVGPHHFSRRSTTIKINDDRIQMSIVDLAWIISCLCQINHPVGREGGSKIKQPAANTVNVASSRADFGGNSPTTYPRSKFSDEKTSRQPGTYGFGRNSAERRVRIWLPPKAWEKGLPVSKPFFKMFTFEVRPGKGVYVDI